MSDSIAKEPMALPTSPGINVFQAMYMGKETKPMHGSSVAATGEGTFELERAAMGRAMS